QEMHCTPVGGHRGVTKTYNRICQNYYWEDMKEEIRRHIQQCLQCQLKKLVRVKTKQSMIITDIPEWTFDKIAMNIVRPLPRTKTGNEYILIMQDQLSKFYLAVPLLDQTAATIADKFVKRFITISGPPKAVLTDQGRNFISDLMRKLAR
ncbi:Retrovirus-related Pol polyprotein from transposon 412, partial [Harpegnathos saltator]